MLLKLILLIGGILIFSAMIYDRFTGKKVTRKLLWPLAGAVAAVFIAIAARGMMN
tara:strand:- start:412 stop:576 length:165 start_codon:yes stop_codon:yes gene_type:complete